MLLERSDFLLQSLLYRQFCFRRPAAASGSVGSCLPLRRRRAATIASSTVAPTAAIRDLPFYLSTAGLRRHPWPVCGILVVGQRRGGCFGICAGFRFGSISSGYGYSLLSVWRHARGRGLRSPPGRGSVGLVFVWDMRNGRRTGTARTTSAAASRKRLLFLQVGIDNHHLSAGWQLPHSSERTGTLA